MKVVSVKNENILEYPNKCACSCMIVIPVNKMVKSNGRAVMGAGLAEKVLIREPGIDIQLGKILSLKKNMSCEIIQRPSRYYAMLATKDDWRNDSTYELIEEGLEALKNHIISEMYPSNVLMPQIGCGLGKLSWTLVRQMVINKLGPIPTNYTLFLFD